MRVRIRKTGFFWDNRVDSSANIDDLVIRADLLDPTTENISIFFRGKDSSGIIDLSNAEAERFVSSLMNKIRLVKKVRDIH